MRMPAIYAAYALCQIKQLEEAVCTRSHLSPKVKTERVPIPPIPRGVIEILHTVIPLPDNIIVGYLHYAAQYTHYFVSCAIEYHHACNGTEEHRVGRQIGREGAATLEEVPRKHTKTHYSGNVASASNILQ